MHLQGNLYVTRNGTTFTVRPFTPYDDAQLRAHIASGATTTLAAKAMGRTRSSVAGRARKLGLRWRGGRVENQHITPNKSPHKPSEHP